MSPKTNSDFTSPVVAKMVQCSDAKFEAFRKKKSSKKVSKETEAIPKVGLLSRGRPFW